jgi:UDP-N-acetylglucosamine 1-carboxyvinyltransferase
VIRGPSALQGTEVVVPDIRGGFAYVLAAAAAQGDTLITNTHHLDRGYNDPIENFAQLGLGITRTEVPVPAAEG